tara:strand:+ start:2063 stop:3373 length:1311 start_codon:yes stop_codon:yes gene_type:complete
MANSKLILKMMGYDIKKADNFLKSRQHLNRDDFKNWQEEKKWKIFDFHYENNTFFREKCNIRVSNWDEIPIMTKTDLQIGLNKLMTKGYNSRNSYIANTSGSSGHPLWFAKDKFCHSLAWSYINQTYKELSSEDSLLEARFFGSIRTDIKSHLKEQLKDYFLNRIRFNVFNQTNDYFNEVINRFRLESFTYLYGYTNSVLAFANFIKEYSDQTLKEICPSLKFVLLTAEMCSEDQRKHMIKIFDLPVYREYGSSETSIIAIEDQEFQWNISTNRLHIEIVDENSIPVQFGQKGRILITDLYNRAMPLIRYEIGDVGSIEKLDKSPFMRLKTLDGRLSDVIHLPNGRKLPGLTFYYISRSLIENGTNIKRFIITQKKINEFVFDYVSDQELSQEIKHKIILESKKYLNSNLDYIFNRVDAIPDKPSGKIQHFFSEVH